MRRGRFFDTEVLLMDILGIEALGEGSALSVDSGALVTSAAAQ